MFSSKPIFYFQSRLWWKLGVRQQEWHKIICTHNLGLLRRRTQIIHTGQNIWLQSVALHILFLNCDDNFLKNFQEICSCTWYQSSLIFSIMAACPTLTFCRWLALGLWQNQGPACIWHRLNSMRVCNFTTQVFAEKLIFTMSSVVLVTMIYWVNLQSVCAQLGCLAIFSCHDSSEKKIYS